MNDFVQWRHWAGSLDDAAFSRLWFALGAVAALRPQGGELGDWIGELWTRTTRDEELGWTMPRFDDPVGLRLRSSTPTDWIARWNALVGNRLQKVPVRISDWSADEASIEWLDALRGTATVASLRLPLVSTSMLGWPLRLAARQEIGHASLKDTLAQWPASALAHVVGADSESFACDVLLLSGGFDRVSAMLSGGEIAASFVVALLPEPLSNRDRARFFALFESSQASGFALVENAPVIDLPGRLNRFIEELSHARRVDVAACLALQGMLRPAIVGLCDDLARFTIRRVADRLQVRSNDLMRATSLSKPVRDELEAILPRLPASTAKETPPSSGLESIGSEAVLGPGGLESLGGDGEAVPPAASAPLAGAIPDYERIEAPYDHEWGGAKDLVAAAEALDRAEAAISANRFLQARSTIVRDLEEIPATRGFVVGLVARVRVHIGPPLHDTSHLPEPFPENALPQELDSWDLQVWLSEPDHLRKPIGAGIILRRTGSSTACTFEFTPETTGPFNGRISVLFRGRIIQTAALRATVVAPDAAPADGLAPTLQSIIQVKRNLSSLDQRRFDLAVVLNHAATDQPVAHLTGQATAWMMNLRAVEATVEDLSELLSGPAWSARDFKQGLDSSKGKGLLRELAQLGNVLHMLLVESRGSGTLDASGSDVLKGEYIQIVSTHSDAIVVPFEFIYEFDAPDDDAEPCAKWREAVQAGRCPNTCVQDATSFCPMGFWGLSKVIERHALQAELANAGEVGVKSEPVPGRDTLKISGAAVYGCSDRVKDAQLDPLRQRLAAAGIAGDKADDWGAWLQLVSQRDRSVLIALAHSDGSGFRATVEIGGQAIKTATITPGHIRSATPGSSGPLVALLGCDMAGTSDAYANPVVVFSTRGAAVVIGTIATVLAEDSADVAARLIHGLTFTDAMPTRRLGEVMRELKRQALLDGELMPLCLVSFGDARWLLSN